jgi:predicted N-acetyltransferase YhbS
VTRPEIFGHPPVTPVQVRQAHPQDLADINAVIERAVMGWRLPERVKRLALPTYFYTVADISHLTLVVATDEHGIVLGLAAWEPAETRDVPSGTSALLLHGLYVDPPYQGHGIGARLLAAAKDAAREAGYGGLLVKAQPDAAGFFEAAGLAHLPVIDPDRDYPYRYWQAVESEGHHGKN